jgi:hypothetical protein
MPRAYLPTGTYKRDNGNFPPFRIINVYAEQTPTSDTQVALISRPGLGLLSTVGSGPINGLFSKAGTLSGDVFSLSGSALYRGTSSIGALAGTGVVSFAGGYGEILVCRGSTMRRYNGSISNVTFPDSAGVRAVCFIGSLFVAVRADDSAKFYWSAPLDGSSWDALDFATAEREPDSLLDIASLGDNIWLFGQSTIEAWSHTGNADLPFTRLENVAFDKGVMSTGCVVAADNGLFFVGSNRSVYRVAEVPERISDHSIEERILASATARLFTFQHEGHEFIAVRLATETLLYDCATQQWTEFQTNGGQWIVSCACMVDKVAYLGHQSNGKIMGWDEWDDLGVEMERRWPWAIPLDDPMSLDNVVFWMNVGQSLVLAGQGSDPVMEVRLSDDAGQTWTDWEDAEIGNAAIGGTGMYRTLPEFRALGMYDFPGVMGECRVTDPVPIRISDVKFNTAHGGRQRV